MKYLFFDCETNGLPLDYKASYEDVNNWPRIITLAWLLVEDTGVILEQGHHLIFPNGWQMPTEKFWIDNGFTQEKNEREGLPVETVVDMFIAAKMQADCLVAHNLNFDHRIIWAEIIRAGREPRKGMPKICTMMKSTKHCNLPNPKGYGAPKWPKLEELHQVLFQRSFEGAHDALSDVLACKDCFFELVRLGIIVPEVVAA